MLQSSALTHQSFLNLKTLTIFSLKTEDCVVYISIVVVDIEIKLMAVAVLGFSSRSYLTVHRPVIYCFHKVSPQLEKPFIFLFFASNLCLGSEKIR